MEFWSRSIAVLLGFIHSFWGNNQPCNDVFLPVERAYSAANRYSYFCRLSLCLHFLTFVLQKVNILASGS